MGRKEWMKNDGEGYDWWDRMKGKGFVFDY
jgi:hypothetical protein